jgi:hypothetical protein
MPQTASITAALPVEPAQRLAAVGRGQGIVDGVLHGPRLAVVVDREDAAASPVRHPRLHLGQRLRQFVQAPGPGFSTGH